MEKAGIEKAWAEAEAAWLAASEALEARAGFELPRD
jgi:hypothetical protein